MQEFISNLPTTIAIALFMSTFMILILLNIISKE